MRQLRVDLQALVHALDRLRQQINGVGVKEYDEVAKIVDKIVLDDMNSERKDDNNDSTVVGSDNN